MLNDPHKYSCTALYLIFAIFLAFKIVKQLPELDKEDTVYDVTTHCYHRNWKLLTYENADLHDVVTCVVESVVQKSQEQFLSFTQFVDALPYISERCAPLFTQMNVYRFGDDEEWRYSMLPVPVPDEVQCYVFVFVGFSRGLAVELQIKRSLLFDCAMFGVDPADSDTAHDFVLNVGPMEQETLKSWNGMNERSLASLVSESLELKRSQAAVVAEHVFVTDIDDVYLFLPHMLDNIGFAKYMVPCQLTIDLPQPDPLQLQIFVNFIRQVIDEERFTILSVLYVDSRTRVYLFNHSHRKCNTRYGTF